MKKIMKITLAALTAGVALSAAGCSGCNSQSGNLSLTSSNWYTGTSYKGIQPSFVTDDEEFKDYGEKLVYGFNFTTDDANSAYSAEYSEGSLITEFYATHYDWNRSGTPEGYKNAETETELLYCYKTEMRVKVRYTLKANGAQSETFEDSAVNECYFRAAGRNLKPVYSRQRVISASPAQYRPSSLETAYSKVDVEYENFYNFACTEVTSFATENGVKGDGVRYPLNTGKSVFDNSSLYIAARSMKLSPSLNETVSLFSAADGGVYDRTLTGSDLQLPAEERKSVSAALAEKRLYIPAQNEPDENGNVAEDAGVRAVAVSVGYSGGTLSGTTQTVWYAAITDPDFNRARATMLKLSIPLSYGLGTLNFTLEEVVSTLWSGEEN